MPLIVGLNLESRKRGVYRYKESNQVQQEGGWLPKPFQTNPDLPHITISDYSYATQMTNVVPPAYCELLKPNYYLLKLPIQFVAIPGGFEVARRVKLLAAYILLCCGSTIHTYYDTVYY